MASVWNVINPSASLADGTYRATVSYLFGTPNSVSVPQSLTLPTSSKRATLTSYKVDQAAKKIYAEFRIETIGAPKVTDARAGVQAMTGEDSAQVLPLAVPISAIVLAVAVVIGLGVVYLSLDKLEQLTESPTGSIFVVAVAAVAALLVWKAVKQ